MLGRMPLVFGLLALCFGASPGFAGRLPVRHYSTDQGLPHDSVGCVERDSHGFLWVGTHGGLTRFDGHEFEVYTTAHGLPVDAATGIVENSDGTYWVSSWWNGISLFDPGAGDPKRLFTPIALESEPRARVHALHGDREGTIWIGTTTGLWRLDTSGPAPTIERVEPHPSSPLMRIRRIWNLIDDRQGNLWMATSGGLAVRSPTGVVSYRPVVGERNLECYSVLEDRDGAIWAGHDEGVTVFEPNGTTRNFTSADGIGAGLIAGLLQSADGKVWLAPMKGGLTEFDGERFRHYAPGTSLGFFLSKHLAEDSRGNIWIGTLDGGVVRLARTGVTAFAETEGLDFSSYASIALDRSGAVIVTAGPAVYRLHDERVARVLPPFLAHHTSGRAGQNSILLIDRAGGWWFGTSHGLYRFPGPGRFEELTTREPRRLDLLGAGLSTDAVSALFEDANGDVWIGVRAAGELGLWDVATGRLQRVNVPDGSLTATVTTFEQDIKGNLWLGSSGGVARYRDGGFEPLFPFSVYDLYNDDEGRLWISTPNDGLVRVDRPWRDRPAFTRYTTKEGLGVDSARGIVGDRLGRIYVGTNAGISRLDPESGSVQQYDTNLGLSNNEIHAALRDREGTLWFTSRRGVSRIEPRTAALDDPAPPVVHVTAVRVAGRPQPVSALGQQRVTGLRIAAGDNQVEIEFGAIAFDLGREVNYQYRLNGAEGDWTVPAAHRSIHYARLAAGDYRFVVRAVNARGVTSEIPAIVEFRVLRPFWQRGWFVTIIAGFLIAGIYLIHRYRLGRVLEMERVRMRIATDLHDDVGSSLSRIAILSEVLQRRIGGKDPALTQPLARIASVSRELVDSMGDIVWAINPRRDRLGDLVQRMRRFAGDTLGAKDIDFVLRAPAADARLRLGADVRRQVYLVFKESVNNAVRHAECSRVEIDLKMSARALSLSIADDGQGFQPAEGGDGHGLVSMRHRAAELGGRLEVESTPGSGTVVRLSIPL